jgi:hypothetical protein
MFALRLVERWREIGWNNSVECSTFERTVVTHGIRALNLGTIGVEPDSGRHHEYNTDAQGLNDRSQVHLQEPKGPRTVCSNSTIEFHSEREHKRAAMI